MKLGVKVIKTIGLKQDSRTGARFTVKKWAKAPLSRLRLATTDKQKIIAMLLRTLPKLSNRIFKLVFLEIAVDCSAIGCLPVL